MLKAPGENKMMATGVERKGPIRFIRARALADRWGCSMMTIWRMRQRAELPEPTQLTRGIVAWRSDIIEALERERTPGAER